MQTNKNINNNMNYTVDNNRVNGKNCMCKYSCDTNNIIT